MSEVNTKEQNEQQAASELPSITTKDAVLIVQGYYLACKQLESLFQELHSMAALAEQSPETVSETAARILMATVSCTGNSMKSLLDNELACAFRHLYRRLGLPMPPEGETINFTPDAEWTKGILEPVKEEILQAEKELKEEMEGLTTEDGSSAILVGKVGRA